MFTTSTFVLRFVERKAKGLVFNVSALSDAGIICKHWGSTPNPALLLSSLFEVLQGEGSRGGERAEEASPFTMPQWVLGSRAKPCTPLPAQRAEGDGGVSLLERSPPFQQGK